MSGTKKEELFPSIFIILKNLFLSRQGHSSKINIDSLNKTNSGEVKQKTYTEKKQSTDEDTHYAAILKPNLNYKTACLMFSRSLKSIFVNHITFTFSSRSIFKCISFIPEVDKPTVHSYSLLRFHLISVCYTHLEKAAVGVCRSCSTSTASQRIYVGRCRTLHCSCKNSNTVIRLPEIVFGMQSSIAYFD